jgi:general secretion pathway protein D
MKSSVRVILVLLAGSVAAPLWAQSTASPEGTDHGVPLVPLLESVAKSRGKKLLVDPHVQGSVHLYGQDPARVDYDALLTILRMDGFTAYEEGGYVHVIPLAEIRQMGLPVVTGSENLPLAQFVTTVIRVKSVPAVYLVPILRPLLPQAGHLAALPCRNALIMVDTLANVRRIKAVIESLDTGEALPPEKCEFRPEPAPVPRDGSR